jgi:hypothetical protein
MASTNITIVRAPKNTEASALLMRELLRWWPLAKALLEVDEALAKRIHLEQGALAYKQYIDSFEGARAEVLPQLRIWACCERLIESIKNSQRDPNNPDKIMSQLGDDECDSLQYLISSFKFREAVIPRDVYIASKLQILASRGVETDGLVMAARFHEHKFDAQKKVGKGFFIPRMAGPTGRRSRDERMN